MASEKLILNGGLVALSAEPGVIAWRNNSGQAWQGTRHFAPIGSTVRVVPGVIVLTDARPITFGLPGSSDILGVARLNAEQAEAYIRRHGNIGLACALEAKTDVGRQSDQQKKFQAAFERAGGRYGLFRSREEAVAHLRGWRGGVG